TCAIASLTAWAPTTNVATVMIIPRYIAFTSPPLFVFCCTHSTSFHFRTSRSLCQPRQAPFEARIVVDRTKLDPATLYDDEAGRDHTSRPAFAGASSACGGGRISAGWTSAVAAGSRKLRRLLLRRPRTTRLRSGQSNLVD